MILIVGGAGYIGSHVNKVLNMNGYETAWPIHFACAIICRGSRWGARQNI